MTQGLGDNPVLVEVTRGEKIESFHRGAVAVADAQGRIVLALGNVRRPIFPRSAIKPLQAIPLIESGAADALGLTDCQLAVVCASHSGERVHLDAVRNILAKAGLDENDLACGAQWPLSERATRELERASERPRAIHNNCSGKHAGMLATAVHLGVEPRGYERPEHPVQVEITRVVSGVCAVRLEQSDMGIDGCSVPTWAMPLGSLAQGVARYASGKGLSPVRAQAAQRLMDACLAAPVMVAGEGRFDTAIMRKLAPSVLVKGGAEGVHCAAMPEVGLGVVVKIDDGAKRAVEMVMMTLLSSLVLDADARLGDRLDAEVRNWRGLEVGRLRASYTLKHALQTLAAHHDFVPNSIAR
jgi:L-asparaginase II